MNETMVKNNLFNYRAVVLETCNKTFNEILHTIKNEKLLEDGFVPQEIEFSLVVNLKNEDGEKLRVICDPKISLLEEY
jgi:uncharacterized protein (DUF111 family)